MVTYDLQGIGLWFAMIPALFLMSFYFYPPKLSFSLWGIISGGIIIAGSFLFAGLSLDALRIAGISTAAFIVTTIIFQLQGRGRFIAFLEILFAASLYFAYISFSRAYADIAAASAGVAKLILIVSLTVFFIHAVTLFLMSFPNAFRKRKREIIILSFIALPVIVSLAILLPASFITNDIEVNPRTSELERKMTPLDEITKGLPGGNLQPEWMEEWERRMREGSGRDREGSLEGMSPDEWQSMDLDNMGSEGGMSTKQYAVMVVATRHSPLYVAYKYWGDLQPVKGFVESKDNPLNKLPNMRLIETWKNPDRELSIDRSPEEIFFLSTLPQKLSVFQPISLSPTIFNEEWRPFTYSYESVSDVSKAGFEQFFDSPGLTETEKQDLAQYLTIPFDQETRDAFKKYLLQAIPPQDSYFGNLYAILDHYSVFQYELGFDERVDVKKMYNFLTKVKSGDCTEFANASAIIARFYGIPTRVVTGFLSDQSLQLPKHKRGLQYLQNKIDLLKNYSLRELMMVTTAHRHAWFQAYIPPYGWIDIEATSYAIPPQLGGNPNDWNLVIPLVEKEKPKNIPDPFPWHIVGLVFLGCVAGGAIALYAFKFIKELVYVFAASTGTVLGAKALGRLLIMRLVNRGFAHKPGSMTFAEYAEQYPSLNGFAHIYDEMCYRTSFAENEFKNLFRQLREQYRRIFYEHRKLGAAKRIACVFSLRGIRY